MFRFDSSDEFVFFSYCAVSGAVLAVADLLEARGLHRTPGKIEILCKIAFFHLMCIP
jgi:hypothetical protein